MTDRITEIARGVLDVPREVADCALRLAGQAQTARDPHAARALADLAEKYGGDMVCGHPVGWWRTEALRYEIEADDRARGLTPTPRTTPTTEGSPMPQREVYHGTAPASLRIEYRSDGKVRFRIEALGQRDAVVDLPDEACDDVVDTLNARPNGPRS